MPVWGGGGGCHPRDNIALSWLANELDLSYDRFDSVMFAREKQSDWLANLMESYDMPLGILGYSFKANTNLTTGSAAVLLHNILIERGHENILCYDPIVEDVKKDLSNEAPRVYLLGANHSIFKSVTLSEGSVLLDPWGCVEHVSKGVKYVPIGR